MRFEVLAGDVVIGWSALEKGDPPMGVAQGVLHASAAYPAMRAGSALRVRPVGGELFDPVGGVVIQDYTADLGPDGIEVIVLGLDHRVYEQSLSASRARLSRAVQMTRQ